MKLAIISHTEHYKTDTGEPVGWGPTVNEINNLAQHFDSITHVAMLHEGKAPKSALAYNAKNIKFVKLPALGGNSLRYKLKLIWYIPKVIREVKTVLKDVDAFQLRTPMGIGVFLIPYLTLFSTKKGWYKYAGNWNQRSPPLGYRLQRWFLKNQKRNVTINGHWHKQPQQCITFENPCLTDDDIIIGKQMRTKKQLTDRINFCYVGRLETPKGVGRIIEAFKNVSNGLKARVGDVHLVGDGFEKQQFEILTENTGINFKFHGFLNRDAVFAIYKESHFFLMPTTASEGFPKVIAEASNFGCVPLVSDVSAIAQYVKHQKNGLIITPTTTEGLAEQLRYIFEMDNLEFQNLLNNNESFVEKFTFTYYNTRVLNEILG